MLSEWFSKWVDLCRLAISSNYYKSEKRAQENNNNEWNSFVNANIKILKPFLNKKLFHKKYITQQMSGDAGPQLQLLFHVVKTHQIFQNTLTTVSEWVSNWVNGWMNKRRTRVHLLQGEIKIQKKPFKVNGQI